MRIENPLPEPYEAEDYDFIFANGIVHPVTIVKDLGDTIDFDTSPLAVMIHYAEKPSQTDPDSKIPAEDLTVMMSHVIMINHRKRLVTPPTREEKDAFQQVFFKPPKT